MRNRRRDAKRGPVHLLDIRSATDRAADVIVRGLADASGIAAVVLAAIHLRARSEPCRWAPTIDANNSRHHHKTMIRASISGLGSRVGRESEARRARQLFGDAIYGSMPPIGGGIIRAAPLRNESSRHPVALARKSRSSRAAANEVSMRCEQHRTAFRVAKFASDRGYRDRDQSNHRMASMVCASCRIPPSALPGEPRTKADAMGLMGRKHPPGGAGKSRWARAARADARSSRGPERFLQVEGPLRA